MDNNERQELVSKTIAWLRHTDDSVKSVGGCGVDVIIRGMSDDLLYTMVANNLYIVPRKVNHEQISK